MANQEILNYIKQNLERGITKEQIWEELKRAGWQEEDMKRAFQDLGLMEMDVLPGIGDLLERVFQTYKDRFWTLVGIMLLPFLLGLVWMGIWQLLGFIFIGVNERVFLESIIPLLFLVSFVLVSLVISVIASLWSSVALIFAIKEKDIGIKEAFARGWHKIISYWWISILLAFLVLGGFLLFFVPGIILSVWFSLALYILVAEDKKGTNALFRSKQLVSGKWWTVFWKVAINFSDGNSSWPNYFFHSLLGNISGSLGNYSFFSYFWFPSLPGFKKI